MQTNPFESQLERLARTLTEEFGVLVTCQGENAWTDGRRIMLPSVPEPMDEGLERMMIGYLDHELAHVAFSDFKVVGEFTKQHPGQEGLLNVVEDALIERRAMERWPGVRHNLDHMFQQIRNRLVRLIKRRGPFERFCTAVYLKLAHYHDMVGLEGEVQGYEDLLAQFPQVRQTQDAGKLVEALLERWLKRPHSQAKPPPQARSQAGQRSDKKKQAPGESGDKDTAQEPSDGQAEANPEQDGDSSGAPNQEQPGQPNPEPEQNQAGESPSPQADEPGGQQGQPDSAGDGGTDTSPSRADGDHLDDTDSCQAADSASTEAGTPQAAGQSRGSGQGGTLMGDAVREAITECIRQLDGSREYRVYTKRHDRIDVVPVADAKDVQALLETGIDTVRRLRRGLTNALRSAEKRCWRDEQLRGELSQRTLYRLCMDRPRLDIFRIRSTVQGKSTA
ncbi:MAG: hypothetical protein KA354_24185, partial [Phycisphaerae bacterium]|nr:hypothetical protein [Phycisphaerae bacterium]